jgi:GDPmannose 4,6-dehydratase
MSNSIGTTALITGITGQDGFYLTKYLLELGYDVSGIVRDSSSPKAQRFVREFPEVRIYSASITNLEDIVSIVDKISPNEIYNLAASSFAGSSWTYAIENGEVNALGVLKLLESIRLITLGNMRDIKFYQASSSEIFGNSLEESQNENSGIKPTSPYGAAKAFGHQITVSYRERYNAFAVSGILYNHESPLRPPEFVSRKITLGVARILKGDQTPIRLGNLDSRRDWGHAADYVRAMHRMMSLGEPSDFVIGTGVTHSVKDMINVAFGYVGISDWGKFVVHDPSELRPTDANSLVADASKAQDGLGWVPEYNFEQMIHEMVERDVKTS